MKISKQEMQEIMNIFKGESDEHLQNISRILIDLEKDPHNNKMIEEIFREAHSLKGAARMIGLSDIEHISHKIEDVFSTVKRGEVTLNSELIDVVYKAIDALNHVIEGNLDKEKRIRVDVDNILHNLNLVKEGKVLSVKGKKDNGAGVKKGIKKRGRKREKEPIIKKKVVSKKEQEELTIATSLIEGRKHLKRELDSKFKKKSDKLLAENEQLKIKTKIEETIRVPIKNLDGLMNQIGEVLVTKIKSDQRLMEMKKIVSLNEMWDKEWSKIKKIENSLIREYPHVKWEEIFDIIRESDSFKEAMNERMTNLYKNLSEDNLRMTLVTTELQNSINKVRMLPLSTIFNLYPRLVRDISKEQKKDIKLEILGGENKLDKKILEELKDPLTHLLRNSIDHGIRLPEQRKQMGKNIVGKIRLSAYQKGSSIVIELEDDGMGIDLQNIKSVALKRRFIDEETFSKMNNRQIMQLIFEPGFSTKKIITDISGRGVGLDVVLTNIERLKGSISVISQYGQGCKFLIKLPLTLASTQVLLVKVTDQIYAIPITAVEMIKEISLNEIATVEAMETIIIDNVPVSLVYLYEILELSPLEDKLMDYDKRFPVVVLETAEGRVAFLVDELLGEQEVVVKSLGGQLKRVRNISGATILGDGKVVMILNVFDLMKSAQKVEGTWVDKKKTKIEEQSKKRSVLVVDDSITTRSLEKSILETAGYKVSLAIDGLNALEVLEQQEVNLIVLDVQMPKMNGFELTEKLRKKKKYKDIPIVLVTSLDAEEDKKRGINVGADAYITKGTFDQGNLLETVGRLI